MPLSGSNIGFDGANDNGNSWGSRDREAVVDAEVTLTHMPSGLQRSARTNDNGEFIFTSLKVGGPYEISAASDGKGEYNPTYTLLQETTHVLA